MYAGIFKKNKNGIIIESVLHIIYSQD